MIIVRVGSKSKNSFTCRPESRDSELGLRHRIWTITKKLLLLKVSWNAYFLEEMGHTYL